MVRLVRDHQGFSIFQKGKAAGAATTAAELQNLNTTN
jgi:hypothetical protein